MWSLLFGIQGSFQLFMDSAIERLVGLLFSQEVKIVVLSGFRIDVESILAHLVGVLAWCWNLDGAAPVEVEVAELVCQILQNASVNV